MFAEVFDHRKENPDVIPRVAKSNVTKVTKKAAISPGLVAMIDVESTPSSGLCRAADRTAISLRGEKSVVLSHGHSIAVAQLVFVVRQALSSLRQGWLRISERRRVYRGGPRRIGAMFGPVGATPVPRHLLLSDLAKRALVDRCAQVWVSLGIGVHVGDVAGFAVGAPRPNRVSVLLVFVELFDWLRDLAITTRLLCRHPSSINVPSAHRGPA